MRGRLTNSEVEDERPSGRLQPVDQRADAHSHARPEARPAGGLFARAEQILPDRVPAPDCFEQQPGYVIAFPEVIACPEAGHAGGAFQTPFVFNSPHSGRHYTAEFLAQSRLSPLLLRRSEDALVDHLFQFAPDLGAPLMMATFPRAYVDLNREPYELDPRLCDQALPAYANTKSVRVAAGLGTVARVVGAGLEIYRKPLPVDDVLARIESCYFPYHERLASLLNSQLGQHGMAVLIDCHSMPSRNRAGKPTGYPDIILGDRFGGSADGALVERLAGLFEAAGYSVGLNQPYAGGYITEHYGRPEGGIHAIQVEMNRALYMDEVRLVPHSGFSELQTQLEAIFTSFVAEHSAALPLTSLAAE